MNKEEFLRVLREKLTGEMDEQQILSHIRYYDQYISDKAVNGKSEEAVIEMLGDPRLIARTLIETKEASGGSYETYGEQSSAQSGNTSQKKHWLDLSTWYGKAIVILIAVGIIALVVTVLSALLPILVVIFLISIAMHYWKKRQ